MTDHKTTAQFELNTTLINLISEIIDKDRIIARVKYMQLPEEARNLFDSLAGKNIFEENVDPTVLTSISLQLVDKNVKSVRGKIRLEEK